ADVVVAGGLKWLRAGFGSGLLSVSPRSIEMMHSTLTGWWGVDDAFDWDTLPPHSARNDAERFHDGGPSFFAAFALAAALEVIEAEGIGVVEATVMENVKAIEDTVRNFGGIVLDPWDDDTERAGILSFQMPGEASSATWQRLEDAEVVASLRGEWVRIAPHASTDLAVLDVVAEVLDSTS
ncbi:MAG: aminotransferase class V-fold PLP-dependent enzyme, partial [bacterium]|nr:aminotransferase class V-fold PLP-dependent enzyme [bacterium]